MKGHQSFVAMTAIAVALLIWIAPVDARVPLCCVDEEPVCCTQNYNCAGCGLESCTECDAVPPPDAECGEPEPCCRNPFTQDCVMMAPDCCEALGYTVMGSCLPCQSAHPAKPEEPDPEETSEASSSSTSIWLVAITAVLLLPAVPMVMRRRTNR
jgi:hypothetical protein